ncbi:MAG: hypothetical protein AAB417_02020 [Patescibacteria group bacterium]
MKKSFPKIWFEPMFLTGSLAVFKIAPKPIIFRGASLFRGLWPRNAFELSSEYSTNSQKSNRQTPRRLRRRPNRTAGVGKSAIGGFAF